MLARHASTRSPRAAAASTANDHSVLLPIPGHALELERRRPTPPSHNPIASRSASRPISGTAAIAHSPDRDANDGCVSRFRRPRIVTLAGNLEV